MLRVIIVGLVMLLAQGAAAQEYLLKPGDRITISVFEDPALNSTALIQPDGKISILLAGSLDAAGVSPAALQDQIQAKLAKDFIEPPTVSVALASLGAPETPPSFYVLGEVGQPGLFTFDAEKPVTVLQALSLAGGPGVFAARERIQLRRYVDDQSGSIRLFDYDAVEDGEVLQPPLFIEDGDVIVVPERGLFSD